MVNKKAKNVVAAQLMYMRRIKSLHKKISSLVRLGSENDALEEAAYGSLEEIEHEIDDINECLRVLAYLQRSEA